MPASANHMHRAAASSAPPTMPDLNSSQPKAQSTAHRQPYTPAANLSRQHPTEQPKTPRPGPAPEGSDSLLYAISLPKYNL